MARLILSTIAFSALAAAIPQHANHLARAHLARSNQLFARSQDVDTLAGRSTISYDGSCGSWSGFTCGDGECCSSEGWCGNTTTHCGAGCQAGFGLCASGSSTPETSESPAAPVTTAAAAVTVASVPTSTSADSATTEPAAGKDSGPGNGDHGSPTSWAAATTTSSEAVYTPPATPSSSSSSSPTATPSSSGSTGSSSGLGDTYKMYTGDGTTGWPSQSDWVDFDTAFSNNKVIMSSSCAQWNVPNNSDDEDNNLKSAIQSVASSTGVDARFILAIVMQESNGCVRAPTTNYGVTNPGLMQSHDGAGSCNRGSVENPCPMQDITQMITDGTAGTSSGDGLKQCISEAKTDDVSKYYKAARIYNSGSIAASGNLQDGIATHCYSSDLANRLTGWVSAPKGCTLG